jgi:hypothetical protein
MKNWRFGAAHYAAIVCTVVLALAACGGDTTVAPTQDAPAPVVASAPAPTAPAPNPSPTPKADNPAVAWEVECSAVGNMTVKYNGEASNAEVLTYYTSFDGPQQFGAENKILATGTEFTRTFPACSQSDAEPLSGPAAGHCYFDKNGVPFNEKRNPEKVTECRNQCVPQWVPVEESFEEGSFGAESVTDGWSACTQVNPNGTQSSIACEQSRTLRNTCTGETKKESRACNPTTVSSFTVHADTHVNGSFNYRVCTEIKNIFGYKTCKDDSIIWTGSLPKGGNSGQVSYPANGNTLYVQVDIGIVWESVSESTTAECAELQADWNEDISFQCSQVCSLPR